MGSFQCVHDISAYFSWTKEDDLQSACSPDQTEELHVGTCQSFERGMHTCDSLSGAGTPGLEFSHPNTKERVLPIWEPLLASRAIGLLYDPRFRKDPYSNTLHRSTSLPTPHNYVKKSSTVNTVNITCSCRPILIAQSATPQQ